MSLSKEQILSSDDIKLEVINIPEWGGDLYIKVMSGEEKEGFETFFLDEDGNRKKEHDTSGLRATLAVWTICNGKGELLFDKSDIPALAKKSSTALDVVWDKSAKLNKILESEIEKLVGNLEGGQNGNSGTSLPSNLESPSSKPKKKSMPKNSRIGKPTTS